MTSLREVQLCGLSILKEVAKICEDNNLKYYLSSGTLLGAVRHQGFIPWDNDIDIEMPIEDYKKFLKLANKALPEWLFLQTYRTDPGYNECWAKVRANGTTSMPLAWKDYQIHLGIGIDIAPIVGLQKDPQKRRRQIKTFQFCRTLLAKEYLLAINAPEWEEKDKLRILYLLPWRVRASLCDLFLRKVFRPVRSSSEVTPAFTRMCYFFKPTCYGDGVRLQFEDGSFVAPSDYDTILKRMYGDYMIPPPIEKRGVGHEGKLGKIIYDSEKDYREYREELRSSQIR